MKSGLISGSYAVSTGRLALGAGSRMSQTARLQMPYWTTLQTFIGANPIYGMQHSLLRPEPESYPAGGPLRPGNAPQRCHRTQSSSVLSPWWGNKSGSELRRPSLVSQAKGSLCGSPILTPYPLAGEFMVNQCQAGDLSGHDWEYGTKIYNSEADPRRLGPCYRDLHYQPHATSSLQSRYSLP